MSLYVFIPLIEVVFCVTLLVLLQIRGKPHVARKPFSLFLIGMGLWGLFIFMMRLSSSAGSALFWEKLVFVAILNAALFFYWFTIGLTGIRPGRWIHYPLHILYFVSMCLIPTGLVVGGMQMMWYGKAPVVGLLFPFYVVCVYAPLVISLVVLLKHNRQSRIVDEKIRTHYIVAGLVAMFIGGTTDYLPAVGVSMYPLGIIGNILFCVMATVAMLRYDLLEMKVILRRGIAYSLGSMFLLGVLGGLILLLGSVFQGAFNPVSLTVTIISVFIAGIAIAVFQPILPRFQGMVDRWFFRQRYDYLQALRRFTRETRGIIDLKQLASSLVTAVANAMQSRNVYLLLPSDANGGFITYSYYGQHHGKRLSLPSGSLLIQTMKYDDNPIDANDLNVIPALSALPVDEEQMLLRNQIELLLPLNNESQLAGILLIGRKFSGEHYSNEDRRLLQTISHEVAASIENARVYESMQTKHGQLLEAMDGVIHAMSLVVETRDPYTAGHQRRVADLACAIGEEMGLSEWQIKGIYITGLLHDVGKLVVPAEILTKPGKLNHSEFSIIQSHPQVGYSILERIEFPWPVRQAILQHHERLDGSGYPEGVSGEHIILEARILGVADVVEAMSSHRPYRPSLGLDNALEEISRGRNVLYDPSVVDACLKLLQKAGGDFERLLDDSQFRVLSSV